MNTLHRRLSFFFSILVVGVSFAARASQSGKANGYKFRFGGGGSESHRRILHQPLFPGSSAPPLITEPPPLPPHPDVPDQPFFPEVSSTPPPPAPASDGRLPLTAAAQPAKPGKKVAIAISVGIVTLGMLSALAFFLYRHRAKHAIENQKLVNGGRDRGSHRFQEDSGAHPSSFLYMGTVEPNQRLAGESNSGGSAAANASPYRKLNSDKISDRYRPSPELQPLPPLAKPPPQSVPSVFSPSPAPSSSDEESRETEFYTPHGSTVSNDDGQSVGSVPRSKRTSPRSRLAAATTTAASSSPEMKLVIIPSIKQKAPLQPPLSVPPSRGSEYNRQQISSSPNRSRFLPLPLPPNMVAFQAINGENSPHRAKAPPPPPPPPRPPPPPPPPPPPEPPQKRPIDLSTPCKPIHSETNNSPATNQSPKKQQFRTPSPPSKPPVDVNSKSAGSAEKTGEEDTNGDRPKLKPLHWDKVRASSDRVTVWDQLKSSSFQLNEDMIERLFGCNSTNSKPKEPIRRSVLPHVESANRVLDPKKSQNIAILLRALNVTRDEVSEALLDGNPESLGAELLETLMKMAPTKEEEIKLRDYSGDMSKLGTAERFLKTILDIPFAFRRVEAMLYRANFDTEVKFLRNSFRTLEVASEELKNSRLFLKLLEAVLRTGNRMNVGTNRGDAKAFKLDTLLKLVDIKGTDGKTTLLHFVVQEIIRSEGIAKDSSNQSLQNGMQSYMKEENFRKQGLQVVSGLSRELSTVKKAAGMDSDVLSGYVSKLETGLGKARSVLQYPESGITVKFFESMKGFLKEAEEAICEIKGDERRALLLVKEVTGYFHGDAVKEEAHPLRIFVIVRDFLGILDNVCKEVRTMQERPVMGSARSFRISGSASLPVLNHYNNAKQDRSWDDESSSP